MLLTGGGAAAPAFETKGLGNGFRGARSFDFGVERNWEVEKECAKLLRFKAKKGSFLCVEQIACDHAGFWH